ncbi:hypothetical protein F52700_6636 [Fusarium sp. NRRL 52700]|nr:hypothetical protein F52700_6636 [Fusarium sp. NRRL 52700]
MFSCFSGLLHIILGYLESPFRRNKVEPMVEPEGCQHDLKQPIQQISDTREAKLTTQWDPCLHNQPNAPLRRHAAPLSPKHDMEPHYWSTNDTEDEDEIRNFSSSELKLVQNDDTQHYRLEPRKHRLATFKDWKEKESTTPPGNRLPTQKRFTASHGQIYDGSDISDDDLVVISRPKRRPRDNLHFACPFYVYDPEKCHQFSSSAMLLF